jgi:diaminopimelate decarboxylase
MEKYRQLAESYGTPLYITDTEEVRRRYNSLECAFDNFDIKYACKSNFDPLILEELGSTEIVAGSSYEAILAAKTGTEIKNIQVTAISPSNQSLQHLVNLSERSKEFTVTVNEYDTVERLADRGFKGRVLIRLKADKKLMSSGKYANGSYLKFGMTDPEVTNSLYHLRESDMEFIGFHSHLGGSIMNEDIDTFCEHAEYVIEQGQRYADIEEIQTFNFGGGLGVPQKDSERELDIETLSDKLGSVLVDEKSTDYVIEPGRYISGPSAVLVTRVTSVKNGEERFVGVDAGMSQFPRTTMFDVYHKISNITSSTEVASQTVAGPTCSGADIFCNNRQFQKARRGDLLAIEDAGAYGFVMSGNFHAYPYPTVVSLEGKESPISNGFNIENL